MWGKAVSSITQSEPAVSSPVTLNSKISPSTEMREPGCFCNPVCDMIASSIYILGRQLSQLSMPIRAEGCRPFGFSRRSTLIQLGKNRGAGHATHRFSPLSRVKFLVRLLLAWCFFRFHGQDSRPAESQETAGDGKDPRSTNEPHLRSSRKNGLRRQAEIPF